MADARVKAVGGVQFAIEPSQRRLGDIQVADIVFGGVFRPPLVQQRPHAMLDVERIDAFAHDVVLMEHVAEEVAVVELVHHVPLQIVGQGFHPLAVVAAKGNVQSDDVFHLAPVHFPVAHRSTGDGEPVQEGAAAGIFIALEKVATVSTTKELAQVFAGVLGSVVSHPQQKVVFVAVAVVAHGCRKVAGQYIHHRLDQPVADAAQAEALEHAIKPAFCGKSGGHPGGAEAVDEQIGILAVALADVERGAMDVFAGNGKAWQLSQ